MIRIEGIFKLTSPLHIADPIEARYDFASGNFVPTSNDSAPQCTRIRQERIIHTGGPADAGSPEKEKPYTHVPVIPANGLRGFLRRCVADLVFDTIAARGGKKLSLDAYHTLTCGAALGSPDSGQATLKEVKAVMNHPVIGLFGGTTKLVRGSIKVFNGYPICPATAEAGITDERYSKFKASTDWLTQVDMFRRDSDVERDIPESAIKGLESPDETIEAWREFLAGNIRRPDGVEPTKGSLRVWAGREVVLPGVAFQIGCEILSYDHAKIGMTLLGLQKLIMRNFLGGRSAIGYGRFKALEFCLFDTTRTRLSQSSMKHTT